MSNLTKEYYKIGDQFVVRDQDSPLNGRVYEIKAHDRNPEKLSLWRRRDPTKYPADRGRDSEWVRLGFASAVPVGQHARIHRAFVENMMMGAAAPSRAIYEYEQDLPE